MRVSVVIPNYNGRHLLEKHLPAVFACLRNGDEVIVVDDASADGSVKFLQRTYPLVHVVAHRNTLRYAQSCNDGVAAAKNPLIFLLNNDVSPEPNALHTAVSHFSHKIVGAIGCLEYDASGKVQGRSVASFQRGMFVHAREKEQTAGPTMWAAGGSMVMRADLWKKLGGMDTLFRPAYYEDIDLGYRTWKAGYGVFFDPISRPRDHQHIGVWKNTNRGHVAQKCLSFYMEKRDRYTHFTASFSVAPVPRDIWRISLTWVTHCRFIPGCTSNG